MSRATASSAGSVPGRPATWRGPSAVGTATAGRLEGRRRAVEERADEDVESRGGLRVARAEGGERPLGLGQIAERAAQLPPQVRAVARRVALEGLAVDVPRLLAEHGPVRGGQVGRLEVDAQAPDA